MRIARDHGQLVSTVEKEPFDELIRYAAHYKHDFNVAEKARLKAEAKAKAKSK